MLEMPGSRDICLGEVQTENEDSRQERSVFQSAKMKWESHQISLGATGYGICFVEF